MLIANPASLFRKLNKVCTQAAQQAVGYCMKYRQSELLIEHFLYAMLQAPNSDIQVLYRSHEQELISMEHRLKQYVLGFPRDLVGKPVFA
jgi:ATP-dependent Clp protease ATP-binding subunit ClpA